MQKKLYHFLIIYDKIKKGKTKEKSSNNQGRKKEKMKNKVASFIITIVMLLIIIVLGLFILFVWQEIFGGDDENIQVENYVSTYNPTSEKSVEDSEKMTTPQIIKDKINQIINNSQTKTEEKENEDGTKTYTGTEYTPVDLKTVLDGDWKTPEEAGMSNTEGATTEYVIMEKVIGYV